MKNKIIFVPYIQGSRSVLNMAGRLDGKALIVNVKKESKYKPKDNHIIVNWGNRSNLARSLGTSGLMLNKPSKINKAANKLNFFESMEQAGVSIPDFTTDPQQAISWYEDEGIEVVGRSVLNGHSGEGIIFASERDRHPDFVWQETPLFTKYIKKFSEFRVHVFLGEVIDIQQKRLRKTDDEGRKIDKNNVDFRIRSHHKGFVFCRENVEANAQIIDLALDSFNALDIDFGAFDIIYNRAQDRAYVLECNTAPGLSGSTVDNYVNALNRLLV